MKFTVMATLLCAVLFSLMISAQTTVTGKTTRAPSRERPRDQDAPKFVEPAAEPEPSTPESEAGAEPEPDSKPKKLREEVEPEEPEPKSGSVSLQAGASLVLALLVNIAAAF